MSGKSLDDLQRELSEWAAVVFPKASIHSVSKHLQEEMTELSYELDLGCYNEADEEAADVLLLLTHYAHFRGKSLMDLVERKMQINRSRQWKDPDEDGVVRHL